MKSLIQKFCFFCLLTACAISCKQVTDPEPEKVSRVVFWSSNEAIKNISVDCYIDGKKIGSLSKISSSAPACTDKKSPVATVEPGYHICSFRAANGQTIEVELDTEINECYNVELM